VRFIRTGKYTYLRNLQGFYPDALQNNYRYRMLAYTEWRELFKAGRLNAVQSQFHQRRPTEQLFDVETDPHGVNNLANDPRHVVALREMRVLMQEKLRKINDLSFYPESHMVQAALGNGVGYGEKHSGEIDRLADISDLSLEPFEQARKSLAKAMQAKNPWERYWACITASVFGDLAKPLVPDAKKLLSDDNLMVRVRAAEFLGSIKSIDPMPTLIGILNESDSPQEVLLTFNTVVYLRDYKGYAIDLSRVKLKVKKGESARRTDYISGKGKL
jgi:hypothetical protein